jgi:ribosomal protein S26
VERCNRRDGALVAAADGVVSLLRCVDCGREVPTAAVAGAATTATIARSAVTR